MTGSPHTENSNQYINQNIDIINNNINNNIIRWNKKSSTFNKYITNNSICEIDYRCSENTENTKNTETTENNKRELMKYLIKSLEKANEAIEILKERVCELKNEKNQLQTVIQAQQKVLEDELTEDTQCNICMSKPKDHAYIVCGHMCTCGDCAQVWGENCPLCRTVSSYVKIIK